MSAYWNPSPAPTHRPVPTYEMKVSKSSLMKKKRKITTCDDSWIDSFHPRPMKGRKEITHTKKLILPKKKKKNWSLFWYSFPQTMMRTNIFLHILIIIYLTWLYYLKLRIMLRHFNKLSEDNLSNFAEEFLKTFTFSDNGRMIIDEDINKHKNKTLHEMRHLLVIGKKITSLYTQQEKLIKRSSYYCIAHC